MIPANFFAFLPEIALLAGALALFFVCLGEGRNAAARLVAMATAFAAILTCVITLGETATLFDGAYRVDAFSQFLKLVFACGFGLILFVTGDLTDIREDIKPEFFLFLVFSVIGLTTLVSSIDLLTLVIALQMSALPLYLMVPMRREREGQRQQMESAVKYIMFGVAANGIMLFGMSYLYGLTGTTSLPVMVKKLAPHVYTPLAIAGLAMTFCGLFYKLAAAPFQFWTPDVYQGSSNETATLIATLPKIGAVAVLARLVSFAGSEHLVISTLLAGLAVASMFYGNLIALAQKDFKRLLGFSGIAHAGYALIGFVALDTAGYAAAIYYMVAYLFMVLACFTVICQVSRDGLNVAIDDFAGLHRRSPLLTVTLLVGVFSLAGIPPFAGFIGKFALLKSALAKGWVLLVVLAVINTAIAIYYYLGIVREACLRDPSSPAPIHLTWPVRALCLLLITANVVLGLAPGRVFDFLTSAIGVALNLAH